MANILINPSILMSRGTGQKSALDGSTSPLVNHLSLYLSLIEFKQAIVSSHLVYLILLQLHCFGVKRNGVL